MTFEGVAVPPGSYSASGAPRARYRATLGFFAAGLILAAMVLALWDHLVKDAAVLHCPPDCGRPPSSPPLADLPRYEALGGAFSVAYPPQGTAYSVTTAPDGVTARYTAGDGGVMHLYGEPANRRVARRVVTDVIAAQFPNATVAYELPNAMLGYQLGYGVVIDFQRPALSARFPLRAVIVAAVKNDIALIATAEGPFRRFSPDFGPGPPSSANLELAMDMGKYIEGFKWKGDPPR